jgi:hypothetical protein
MIEPNGARCDIAAYGALRFGPAAKCTNKMQRTDLYFGWLIRN